MSAPIELAHYRSIVVLTGAGISAASGLPTYRGTGGVWETVNIETHATAEALQRDPSRVWRFFAETRKRLALAVPNSAHLALALAEHRLHAGQTLTVLTQNVDGLHKLAGSKRVVELHGTLRRSRCTRCEFERLEDLSASESECPRCPACTAPLRPSVVLFNEALPVDAEWEAQKSLRECDLFLAVGTSGTVFPAANFVHSAEYAGARTIYVNLTPLVPHHPAFGEILLGRAEQLLPSLFGFSAEAAPNLCS